MGQIIVAGQAAPLPGSGAGRRTFALADALFLGTLAVLAALYLSGIRQNLPFYVEGDEWSRVDRVRGMVANADLNPHWFGHPASTVLYPLFLITYLWNVTLLGGPAWGPDPQFVQVFQATPVPFYLLGRLVSLAYALLSIPLLYRVARRIFDARVAVVAVWLSSVYIILVAYAQVARSDSAGLFFSLLSVYMALRYFNRPSTRNHLLAGGAVGLAASSRYPMAIFGLALLLAEAWHLWRAYRTGHPCRPHALRLATLPLVCLGAFLLTTPFFVLDFDTVRVNLEYETRSNAFGSDGLPPLGKFLWYLSYALPWSVTWQQVALALGGVLLALRARRPAAMALVLIALAYLIGISLPNLHWRRWLIQALPYVAILAASCLVWLHGGLTERLRLGPRGANLLLGLLLTAVLAVPLYDTVLFTVRQTGYSTRIAAREWALDHWPNGSKVVMEPGTLLGFAAAYPFSAPGKNFNLSSTGGSLFSEEVLQSYVARGINFLVVSSEYWEKTFGEPERYAAENASYLRLFAEHELAAEFRPEPVRPGSEEWANRPAARYGSGGGNIIRVYRIAP